MKYVGRLFLVVVGVLLILFAFTRGPNYSGIAEWQVSVMKGTCEKNGWSSPAVPVLATDGLPQTIAAQPADSRRAWCQQFVTEWFASMDADTIAIMRSKDPDFDDWWDTDKRATVVERIVDEMLRSASH